MADKASITRSLSNVRTELDYLRNSGVLHPQQYESIVAQLPQTNGIPSEYVDPRYAQGTNNIDPGAIAKASQDPNHPAHPSHPKHAEWARKLGSRFGNAALFGAGATAGSDLVNSILR